MRWFVLAVLAWLAARASKAQGMPQGKGVFITSLTRQGSPSPAELAAWLVAHDIRWCAIQVYWKNRGEPVAMHNGPVLREVCAALADAGVRVWVWGFPSPDDVSGFVRRVAWSYGQEVAGWSAPPRPGDVDGVIADPEAPYQGDYATQATATMAGLVALGRPVGVTSYPLPAWHPSFPWEAWARGASFGVPQQYTYRGDDWSTRSLDGYKAAGFPVAFPALGGSSAHSPEEMRRNYLAADTSAGAVVWWSLRHLMLNANRAEVVRSVPEPGRAVVA